MRNNEPYLKYWNTLLATIPNVVIAGGTPPLGLKKTYLEKNVFKFLRYEKMAYLEKKCV